MTDIEGFLTIYGHSDNLLNNKEKYPAIAEKIAGLIDMMATGGLSPETVKERVEKSPPPENCTFLAITTIIEEIWNLLSRRSSTVDLDFQQVQEPLVQGLSARSILGDQLVKDLHAGTINNYPAKSRGISPDT